MDGCKEGGFDVVYVSSSSTFDVFKMRIRRVKQVISERANTALIVAALTLGSSRQVRADNTKNQLSRLATCVLLLLLLLPVALPKLGSKNIFFPPHLSLMLLQSI